MIVSGIKEATSKLSTKDYSVLLVDFDGRDTSAELRKFRRKRRIDQGWTLAVARGEELKKLTESVDFKFFYDKETNMFAHPNVLVVLSPSLKVSGYMLGVKFDPSKLSVMLEKARADRVELSWVRGLLLKCFRYDPVTGTFVIDWSFVAMVVGGLLRRFEEGCVIWEVFVSVNFMS